MEIMNTDTQSVPSVRIEAETKPRDVYGHAKENLLLFSCQSSIQLNSGTPDGGVAQLGEHLPCKQGVMGSNPIISTIFQDRGVRLRLEK